MSDEEQIDFAALDPAEDPEGWEGRIAEVTQQAEALRAQSEGGYDLRVLDPFSSPERREARISAIMDGVSRASGDASDGEITRLTEDVRKLGPSAMMLGFAAAAAVWFVTWFGGSGQIWSADASPAAAYQLATWAEQGSIPTTQTVLTVMESNDEAR